MVLVTDSAEDILSSALEDCKLIVFKQTLAGIEPIGKVDVPFPSSYPRSDLERIASFFSVAIGQGDCFAEGLYGPLPVLNSDYEALVFSKLIPDRKKFDPRMRGMNYVFFCFFYPKKMEFLINAKRFRLGAEMSMFISELSDVEQILDQIVNELDKSLKSFLF